MAENHRFIVLSVPKLEVLKRAEILLKNEARVRGTTVGWTLYLLVNEAADVDSYPGKLRRRLKHVRDAADAQCSESLKRSFGGRTKPASESAVSGRDSTYRIQFATPECYLVVRTILAYEAAIRGLTVSQAACRLVEKAAEPCTYPANARSELDRVDRELSARAAGASMEVLEGSRENGNPGKGPRR